MCSARAESASYGVWGEKICPILARSFELVPYSSGRVPLIIDSTGVENQRSGVSGKPLQWKGGYSGKGTLFTK